VGRRRSNIVEDLIEITSKLPWWVDVVLAIAAYVWLHGIATSEVTAVAQPGKMGEFVGQSLFKTLATIGQYLLPFAFMVGAVMSAYGRSKRNKLHEQVANNPERAVLNDMSWQEFEALVGEAFRRKGYSVLDVGGGGADGGVDLVLLKGKESFLVQCKQWKAYKVGVDVVRELYGVMAAKGATGGFVVTSGTFTDDAKAFASDQNIMLLDGKALHELIRGINVPTSKPAQTTATPTCPVCQSAMIKRTAKRGANVGNEFWGCSSYPACKGTRPV
jgi:restriction system protein